MERRKGKWDRDPYPGELLYHLKWTHGVWVSNSKSTSELDHVHRQLHGPAPEGWAEGCWEADHSHIWGQQLELSAPEEGIWEW